MKRTLTDQERTDWLQLIRTPHIGPVTFFRLIRKFGTAGEALAMLPDFSRQSGRKTPLKPANRDDAQAEINRAQRRGVILIAACEPQYPDPMRAIADPPPILFVRGHVHLFEKPAIAIIGARNASGIGCKFARQLARDLGAAGLVIVSGLARGIDGAAHGAALESGTIAVVAGGVDHIYPPEHEELTHRIADQGIVVSERPLGTEPTARDFPRRNRLISGLGRGVVIVEAAARSGTLITARFALEQGREVFAVPGSPLDPRSQGANGLIRDGATLVESADDILQVLAGQKHHLLESDGFDDHGDALLDPLAPYKAGSDGGALDDSAYIEEVRCEVLGLLSYTPLHRDEILRQCNAPPGPIADALLTLVLGGEAVESGGGCFIRAGED